MMASNAPSLSSDDSNAVQCRDRLAKQFQDMETRFSERKQFKELIAVTDQKSFEDFVSKVNEKFTERLNSRRSGYWAAGEHFFTIFSSVRNILKDYLAIADL